jgi:hypothetical protein
MKTNAAESPESAPGKMIWRQAGMAGEVPVSVSAAQHETHRYNDKNKTVDCKMVLIMTFSPFLE